MWCPLSMRTPRRSSAHALQIASGSPYRSSRSSWIDQARSVGQATRRPAARSASSCGAVDPEAGAVVLAHRVHRGRVVDRAPVVGVRLLAHRLRRRPRYQASGSAEITRSAGLSVWPRKNQCHQLAAKRASQRSSALGDRHARRARRARSPRPDGRAPCRNADVARPGRARRPRTARARARASAPRSRAPSRAWSTARGRRSWAAWTTRRSRAGRGRRRCARRASSGATRCHVTCVRGCPCSSRSGGPSPPWRTRSTASPDVDPLEREAVEHHRLLPGGSRSQSGCHHGRPRQRSDGGVPERLNGAVLKTAEPVRAPGVRIPPPPLAPATPRQPRRAGAPPARSPSTRRRGGRGGAGCRPPRTRRPRGPRDWPCCR